LDAETMRQAHGLFRKLEELQVEIGSGLPARFAFPKNCSSWIGLTRPVLGVERLFLT